MPSNTVVDSDREKSVIVTPASISVHDHATRQVTFKEIADEAMDRGAESRTEALLGRADPFTSDHGLLDVEVGTTHRDRHAE